MLKAGDASVNNNFGELLPASISGFVYVDANNDGIKDSTESPIAGVSVLLTGTDDLGNSVNTTAITAADGSYSFTALRPGTYTLAETQPATYFDGKDTAGSLGGNVSNDNIAAIVLKAGDASMNNNFGELLPASISGIVYVDANNDGIKGGTESGISAVTLTLSGTDDNNQTVSRTTTTAADGSYSFANLRPGSYSVAESQPTGFLDGKDSAGTSGGTVGPDLISAITLASGTNATGVNFGELLGSGPLPGGGGDLTITKTDGLTTVFAGQSVTYSIVVSNTGTGAANGAVVKDLIPANLTNVTWSSVANGGANGNAATGSGSINQVVNLPSGSSITYTLTGTVVGPATTLGSKTCFDLDGNTALDGTDGNVRTFTANGITLTARAFSRVDGTNGAWSTAWLGSYSGGLGVTDSAEGNGSGTHRVDNIGGRDNYVLFRFSESVVLDRAYLQYVIDDSDISLWIGNSSTPLTSLSDSVLSGMRFNEVNETTSCNDRWADVNAGRFAGNTVVIAASVVDLTPEDQFKIRYLEVNKLASTSSTLVNTATVTAPVGFTDTITGNNTATDTDTIGAAPGVRTPGFWGNTNWRRFWDGTAGNEPTQSGTANFPTGDLLLAPFVNSSQTGRVTDPVTGVAATTAGLLIGDFNRNGITDSGEDTLFYSTTEALKILDPSQNPDKNDVRYTLARNVVASWLNHLAGNPLDTAATNDKDARYYLKEGINWLQALSPDENGDKKGDGSLSGLNAVVTSPAIASNSSFWNGPGAITSAASLPTAYRGNTSVAYGIGIDPGSVISTALDNYNNGRGLLADGLFYGGNA